MSLVSPAIARSLPNVRYLPTKSLLEQFASVESASGHDLGYTGDVEIDLYPVDKNGERTNEKFPVVLHVVANYSGESILLGTQQHAEWGMDTAHKTMTKTITSARGVEVEFPFSVTERGVQLKPSAKAEAVLPTNHDNDDDVFAPGWLERHVERCIAQGHGVTAIGELAAQVAQTRGLHDPLYELGTPSPSVPIAGADGRLRVLADQTDELVQAGLCKWVDGAPSKGETPPKKEAEPPDGSTTGTTRRGRRMLKAVRAARPSKSMAATRWSYGLTAFLAFLAPLALALALGVTTTTPPEIDQVDWLHSVDAPKRLETVTNGLPVRVHERRQVAEEAPASKAPRPSYLPKQVGVWAEWERDDYYGFHQAARPFGLNEIEEIVRRALSPTAPSAPAAEGGFAPKDPTDPNGNFDHGPQASSSTRGTPHEQSFDNPTATEDLRAVPVPQSPYRPDEHTGLNGSGGHSHAGAAKTSAIRASPGAMGTPHRPSTGSATASGGSREGYAPPHVHYTYRPELQNGPNGSLSSDRGLPTVITN